MQQAFPTHAFVCPLLHLVVRYICKAVAGRVPPSERHRFIEPTALLLGGRGSVLVAPLGPQGSLQDLVNAYLAQGQVGLTGWLADDAWCLTGTAVQRWLLRLHRLVPSPSVLTLLSQNTTVRNAQPTVSIA